MIDTGSGFVAKADFVLSGSTSRHCFPWLAEYCFTGVVTRDSPAYYCQYNLIHVGVGSARSTIFAIGRSASARYGICGPAELVPRGISSLAQLCGFGPGGGVSQARAEALTTTAATIGPRRTCATVWSTSSARRGKIDTVKARAIDPYILLFGSGRNRLSGADWRIRESVYSCERLT